jgi:hypothetical protein
MLREIGELKQKARELMDASESFIEKFTLKKNELNRARTDYEAQSRLFKWTLPDELFGRRRGRRIHFAPKR